MYICKQATEGPNGWNNPSKFVLPHEILKVEQLLPGPFGETGNSCQDHRRLQKCSVWDITFWSSERDKSEARSVSSAAVRTPPLLMHLLQTQPFLKCKNITTAMIYRPVASFPKFFDHFRMLTYHMNSALTLILSVSG